MALPGTATASKRTAREMEMDWQHGETACYSPLSECTDATGRMYSEDECKDAAIPRRRQNRSCDHCRLGKRRCDVRIKAGDLSTFTPCTNCKRWKKQCTIEWIKTRERNPPIPTGGRPRRKSTAGTGSELPALQETTSETWSPMGSSSSSSEFRLNEGINIPPRRINPHITLDSSFPWSSAGMAGPKILPDMRQNVPGPDTQLFPHDGGTAACSPDLAGFASSSAMASMGSSTFNDPYERPAGHFPPIPVPLVPADVEPTLPLSSNPAIGTSSIANASAPIEPQQHMVHSGYITDEQNNDVPGQEDGRLTPRTAIRYNLFRPSSPFAMQFLAKDYSRIQIKEGLLKIYRDSMEGALSCWLTERNCPYSFSPFNGKDLLDGRDVWGSNWASRMVTRVCALDKEYVKAGVLSKRDQQQGAKILNLVVMAFAAQWSQAGRRHDAAHTDYSSSSSESAAATGQACSDPPIQQLGEESFGRNTQKALWHKANRALSEASDNNSFQAVFAGIIFSLTQRPINGTEVLDELQPSGTDELTSLFKVLDLDGPTLSLDAANRKMHDHRRKLRDAKQPGMYGARAPIKLSDAHEETFGLLYWLAVMFDTLSAAINRRSFTINDMESNFSRAGGDSKPRTVRHDSGLPQGYMLPEQELNDEAAVWGDYFLREQSRTGQLRSQSTRWPCQYHEAASCLADAAPVKVLLYRRLGQVQSLYYQGALPQLIENGLEATMEVYNHWNNTYGLFIEDCMRYHEELPARIQSWYTLLTGHWNLAVLIFVDLIDTMDSANMTLPTHANLRKSISFTSHLRDTAVYAICELGRCCRAGDEPLAFTQSPDFHHAVNKAALLTEPWTVVLVRTFGYAGAILARRLHLDQPPESGLALGTYSKERLQYCIDALSLLGKKSDMAMCAAELLSRYTNRSKF
ncbi:Regulatory protein alcR [Fulvia fulva]|uniref:Regulatory protein alcR n=1 Tax=Passalora fulva TaxID=5499 RepID=A0A9Q8LJ92_PASFU|nr:Regulatory protein alcR [Fulvia fulva]KAK4623531.1 Regulatory protein alcR [Fulvia fulva]KAK4625222.1 Regulatory protein alcR [Fulvia fulva]UJO18400.1 Regulatory protein alcR [Fulvia fulva]WPV15288.1 Regulatory protein alcR [Fulvia fulva]WPV29730.1 Regulatory protein alcR [Fulvia fulva]